MKPNLLFLTLKVFSATGGIEKVSRLAGRAFCELCAEAGLSFSLYAAYDKSSDADSRYVRAGTFQGFGGRKKAFALAALQNGVRADVVVLSHINLLSLGYLIKKISPRTKVVLLAHGIEVWRAFPAWKKAMLKTCDLVLPVSHFTKQKIASLHGIGEEKLMVVNNCLDPYLQPPSSGGKSNELLNRYKLTPQNKILFTLTRLSYKERYKGYDEVLMALKALKAEMPELRYLIAGKSDEKEKARLERMIRQQGLEGEVIFAGFVPDEEMAAHFGLADVYIMPSRKEGFGLVFIEALYYGKPVIAGNADGSVDALAKGKLGILVSPGNPKEIRAAVKKILVESQETAFLRKEVIARFGFPVYKEALRLALLPFLPMPDLSKVAENVCDAV